jgi:hypothetical protein
MRFNRTLGATLLASAAIVSAQCGGNSPSSPSARLSSVDAPITASDRVSSTRAAGDIVNSTATLGQVRVCKLGDVSGSFTVAGGNADVSTVANVTVQPGTCVIVAQSASPAGSGPASTPASITVTESPATDLQGVTVVTNSAGSIGAPAAGTNPQTVIVNNYHGYVITFTNDAPDPPPPPPPGNEGCTPGYWKQDQHLDSWVGTGYAPGDDFDATFGVNFFTPNQTLVQAAGANGGGTDALARHAVAALLNSASADVDYPYTTAQVLDIVQGDGAYAGLSVEARKNLLAAANELGCDLN